MGENWTSAGTWPYLTEGLAVAGEAPVGAAFAVVYIANESSQPVYFDDLYVQQTGLVVRQENHYYPFGMNIKTLQQRGSPDHPYTYNGKELNEELGLHWHDYGARFYDAQLGKFHTHDRFAEKYAPLSPYQYTAGNPIKYIDVNGDSIIVLLASESVGGAGHMAILINAEGGGWRYYSHEGGKSMSTGPQVNSPRGKFFASLSDFTREVNSEGVYDEAYLIPTNEEQDSKARSEAGGLNGDGSFYNVFTSNCADVCSNALVAAGKSGGSYMQEDPEFGIVMREPKMIPNQRMKDIKQQNSGFDVTASIYPNINNESSSNEYQSSSTNKSQSVSQLKALIDIINWATNNFYGDE